jgi:hypothetical protein
VAKATRDFRTKNLLDIYLQLNPAQVRTKEDMKELDANYKRGEEVLPHTGFEWLTVRFACMSRCIFLFRLGNRRSGGSVGKMKRRGRRGRRRKNGTWSCRRKWIIISCGNCARSILH